MKIPGPDHPITITPSRERVRVTFNGKVVADTQRALALGARSCIVGRSYIYGLGAGGQAGVARAIEILHKEFDVTMALCGVSKTGDITRDVLAATESQRSI